MDDDPRIGRVHTHPRMNFDHMIFQCKDCTLCNFYHAECLKTFVRPSCCFGKCSRFLHLESPLRWYLLWCKTDQGRTHLGWTSFFLLKQVFKLNLRFSCYFKLSSFPKPLSLSLEAFWSFALLHHLQHLLNQCFLARCSQFWLTCYWLDALHRFHIFNQTYHLRHRKMENLIFKAWLDVNLHHIHVLIRTDEKINHLFP